MNGKKKNVRRRRKSMKNEDMKIETTEIYFFLRSECCCSLFAIRFVHTLGLRLPRKSRLPPIFVLEQLKFVPYQL